MRGYSQLADLESLLLNIADKNIRSYAGEAIASYSAGANRAAIVSIWITVVYDLYQKFLLLSEQYSDPAAKACITTIDNIRNNQNKAKIAAWEREILSKAYDDVKIITPTEYEHLDRIQKDRHRCAHPVLDDEGLLFQPTPELTRTHIRTAIEVLLSQPPVMGKASGDALIRDIEETSYFPDDLEGVKKAIHKRHFKTSDKYRLNLFKLSLKKILYLELKEKENIERYILVFRCLCQEHRNIFESIERKSFSNIIDKVTEDRYKFLIKLVYFEEDIWNNCSSYIQEKLKAYCQAKEVKTTEDKKELLQAICRVRGIEDRIYSLYIDLTLNKKRNFISYMKTIDLQDKNPDFVKKIINYNIALFTKSEKFVIAKQRGEYLISIIIDLLDNNNIIHLLDQSIVNQEEGYDQLKDCTSYFKEVFQETIDKYPNTLSDWKNFVEKKNGRYREDFEELQALIESR